MRVALLAGGTGGAKLARGLDSELEPGELTVVVNTADDEEFWGLHVSPDVDSVLYRLAGMFNEEAGFGVAGESFATLRQLQALGEQTWFSLGDRDLATHILRTLALRQGATLTEATLQLCARLQLHAQVLPMTDDPVRTVFDTDAGTLRFQEWFVREHCGPRVRAIRFDGLDRAAPSATVVSALLRADLIVIGPSNPLISVDPLLQLFGRLLQHRRGHVMAVTPLVQGRALKGPTAGMLRDLGMGTDPAALGRHYAPWAGTFVLDERDAEHAEAVRAEGISVLSCDTVMADVDGERRLARELLERTNVR